MALTLCAITSYRDLESPKAGATAVDQQHENPLLRPTRRLIRRWSQWRGALTRPYFPMA